MGEREQTSNIRCPKSESPIRSCIVESVKKVGNMGAYTLEPIGFIRSTVKGREDAPRQGPEGAPDVWLEIEPRFADALLGMEVGRELIVITWLHEAKRDVLKGHPRNDPNLSAHRRILHALTCATEPTRAASGDCPRDRSAFARWLRRDKRHSHKDRADRGIDRHTGSGYQISVDSRGWMIAKRAVISCAFYRSYLNGVDETPLLTNSSPDRQPGARDDGLR